MSRDECRISIIVPVYNAEAYLTQCLDSLVNQTYQNVEIICINDGSVDRSLDILYSYASKDSRIIVINKENTGVSDTRNVGMEKVSGEYIMFVDSDDWLDCNTCERAIESMRLSHADIVMWSYISEGANKSTHKEIFPYDICFEEEDVKQKLHRRFVGLLDEELAHPELADSLCPVWGKLYRRELIVENAVSFIDLNRIGTYEDGLFNLEVFRYAKRVVYLNQCFYHYRRQERNSVTSGYHERLFEQWQNLFQIIEKYIEKNHLGEKYLRALDNRVALSTVGLTLNIVRSDHLVFKKVLMIKMFLGEQKYRQAYCNLNFMHFPLHWKAFYLCAKKRFSLGVFLLGTVIQKIISR